MKRSILLGLVLGLLASSVAVHVLAADPTPPPGGGLPDPVSVTVSSWSSDGGRAYVGVKAKGHWAPPADTRTRVRTEFYSEWDHQGSPQAYYTAWWIFVHRTADDSTVNFDSPIALHTSIDEPGIGIAPVGYGDLSLYLDVGVEPVTAPARSERTVSSELTAGWRDFVDDALAAYVRPETVRVVRWTVDFGDGTRRTFPGDGSDRLVTTHTYDAGEFDVIVTARVTGEAYGAFFTPDGVPYEEVVPFELNISNRASGVAALPIEYLPPVVVPGGSPSGTMPGGQPVVADAAGHAQFYWPRGLPCDLFVRAVIQEEAFMRSGGVVIGGATTRLISYRYLGGENDRSGGSGAGTYDADQPLRMQWNTPLPDSGSYPIRVELTVETTYDDGTVRTFEFEGSIAATVVYSSISH